MLRKPAKVKKSFVLDEEGFCDQLIILCNYSLKSISDHEIQR